MNQVPSYQHAALGRCPDADTVTAIIEDWLARPNDLYQLQQEEKAFLLKIAYRVSLTLYERLREADRKVYNSQPHVIEAQSKARAVATEALKDPQQLLALSNAEWWSLQRTADASGDRTMGDQLTAARNKVRDAQPHLVDAFSQVQEALNDDRILLAANGKTWSALLKTADSLPSDYNGRREWQSFRQELVESKTRATMQNRLDSEPTSDLQHIGVKGVFDLAFVRKLDALISTNWWTVPRLSIAKKRAAVMFNDGVPDAQVCAPDACFGSAFLGIPLSAEISNSTSIICPKKEGAILKMFDFGVFYASVSPELEAYFRTVSQFPWEQACADEQPL